MAVPKDSQGRKKYLVAKRTRRVVVISTIVVWLMTALLLLVLATIRPASYVYVHLAVSDLRFRIAKSPSGGIFNGASLAALHIAGLKALQVLQVASTTLTVDNAPLDQARRFELIGTDPFASCTTSRTRLDYLTLSAGSGIHLTAERRTPLVVVMDLETATSAGQLAFANRLNLQCAYVRLSGDGPAKEIHTVTAIAPAGVLTFEMGANPAIAMELGQSDKLEDEHQLEIKGCPEFVHDESNGRLTSSIVTSEANEILFGQGTGRQLNVRSSEFVTLNDCNLIANVVHAGAVIDVGFTGTVGRVATGGSIADVRDVTPTALEQLSNERRWVLALGAFPTIASAAMAILVLFGIKEEK